MSYHHGNLRSALLASATELAREAGPDAVVLREVARRTGVSHNAAYRHFADRDALLEAVAEEGMAGLERLMRVRMAEVDAGEPAEAAMARLKAVGRAYVEFALEEAGLFEAVFGGFTLLSQVDSYQTSIEGPYVLLNQVLDECVAAGAVDAAHRPGAELSCWAAVHGFAVLHQRGPLKLSPGPDRDAALEGMLDVFERGLRG